MSGGQRRGAPQNGRPPSADFLLERLATARPQAPASAGAAGPRPAYREEAPFKIPGGCGLMGICDESGALMPADVAVRAMAIQRDRGNGLGAGFAGYGIYPEFPDHFCFHLMLHDERAREEVEAVLERSFVIDQAEPIPTRHFGAGVEVPLLWRYFLLPDPHALETLEIGAEDLVVHIVMQINAHVQGAFVASYSSRR
jgi:glutamate synthase domain-containing protein 1